MLVECPCPKFRNCDIGLEGSLRMVLPVEELSKIIIVELCQGLNGALVKHCTPTAAILVQAWEGASFMALSL